MFVDSRHGKRKKSSPWNLLFVSPFTEIGGGETFLLTLFDYLDRSRFYPVVVCPKSDGAFFAECVQRGIPSYSLRFSPWQKSAPWGFFKTVRTLNRFISSHAVDLVFCNRNDYWLYFAWISRIHRVPVVGHIVSFYQNGGGYLSSLLSRIVPPSLVSFVASSQCLLDQESVKSLPGCSFQVIYDGIDLNQFGSHSHQDREEIRKALGLEAVDFAIGMFGRFAGYKRHCDVIEAACLSRSCSGLHWFIIGDASHSGEKELYESLVKRVEKEDLRNRVQFLGFRNDIAGLMRAMDVVVVPSEGEPLGRVVLEAMAVGTPVVGTNTGGIPEILTHEQEGILVAPRSPHQIVSAILRLRDETELRQRLIDRARNRVASEFSAARCVEKYQDLFKRLIRR